MDFQATTPIRLDGTFVEDSFREPRRYQARAFDATRRRFCPPDAIYVGRPCWGWKGSPWANPYPVEEYGRDVALGLFAAYAIHRAAQEPDWLEPLRGRDVVCWCKPADDCHGDLLIRLANAAT